MQLHNLRLEEGGDMDEFLTSVTRISHEISNATGEVVSKGELKTVILRGLPDSYRQWVHGKMTSPENETIEGLQSELRAIAIFEKEKIRSEYGDDYGYVSYRKGGGQKQVQRFVHSKPREQTNFRSKEFFD